MGKKKKYFTVRRVILDVSFILLIVGLLGSYLAFQKKNDFWLNIMSEVFGLGFGFLIVMSGLSILFIYHQIKKTLKAVK